MCLSGRMLSSFSAILIVMVLFTVPSLTSGATITNQSQQPAGPNVEAAIIYMISCNEAGENGGIFWIYEYLDRPGYRAVVPNIWQAIGGSDVATFEEAVQLACAGRPFDLSGQWTLRFIWQVTWCDFVGTLAGGGQSFSFTGQRHATSYFGNVPVGPGTINCQIQGPFDKDPQGTVADGVVTCTALFTPQDQPPIQWDGRNEVWFEWVADPFTASPRFKLVIKPSDANVGYDASQQKWVPIVGSWLNPPDFPPQ